LNKYLHLNGSDSDYLSSIIKKLIDRKILLIICGPTCIGKSKLAFHVARILDTDLISADSMQAYKGMNIGTAKYNLPDSLIKQYMIDIVDPDYNLTVIEFRNKVREIIEDKFFKIRKIPVLVGGSGLHIRCVIDDLAQVPEADPNIRKILKNTIKSKGLAALYEKLKKVDPLYSKKISPNDEKRIIRALEVEESSGKPFSSFQINWNKREEIYDIIFLGLIADRNKLYKDIELRVDEMFEKGLVKEVRSLKEKGYDQNYSFKQAIGYKEVLKYINNQINLEECKEEVKKNTRNLAKKQITWFKADNRITWINTDDFDKITDLTKHTLKVVGEKLSDESY
jgi:tRNA dimethylallyltransferase